MSGEVGTESLSVTTKCAVCGHTEPRTIDVQAWDVEKYLLFDCTECDATQKNKFDVEGVAR